METNQDIHLSAILDVKPVKRQKKRALSSVFVKYAKKKTRPRGKQGIVEPTAK